MSKPASVIACPAALRVALALTAVAVGGCEVELSEPPGTAGALGVARFTTTLQGDLAAAPIALGANFAITAGTDGCDRLTTTCDAEGTLLVVAADEQRLRINPRADGAFGVEAIGRGSNLLLALNASNEVVDYLDVQVASPIAVGLTDQAVDGRGAVALPLSFGVATGDAVDLRPVLIDRDHRVLLGSDAAFTVDIELRDLDDALVADDVLSPSVVAMDGRLRLRAPDSPASFRAVVYASDRSVSASVFRIDVVSADQAPRLLVDVNDVASRPGFDVVEVDLCAVREQSGNDGSLFMVGSGYAWHPPWGFSIVDKDLQDTLRDADAVDDHARCVRAVRFDDREVPTNDQFFASWGTSTATVPYGVALGRVQRPKGFWASLWEAGTGALLPPPEGE